MVTGATSTLLDPMRTWLPMVVFVFVYAVVIGGDCARANVACSPMVVSPM